ncbi:MAG: SGNH/GDSL hydrolase family protein [Opitutaceae bacterium]
MSIHPSRWILALLALMAAAIAPVAGETAGVSPGEAVQGTLPAKKPTVPLPHKDLRADPVKRVVALGESITWGYSASSKDQCWVNQVVRLLEEFQGEKIELINSGIGNNVLTPACPAYPYSTKPSALERLDADLIRYRPDLVFLAYGLTDSRGGTPSETFRRAYQELIDRIRAKINPTIVIVTIYYMHAPFYDDVRTHMAESNYEVTDIYNLVIKQLAEDNGLILADAYAAEKGVDWVVDQDHVHPNDLGHRLIANRVFEAIVRNCSFTARQMPKQTLIQAFLQKYGNGPDRPVADEQQK